MILLAWDEDRAWQQAKLRLRRGWWTGTHA